MFFKTIQIQNLLGENICHIEQYLIVVEKCVVADVATLWKAVAILITWYYIEILEIFHLPAKSSGYHLATL